MTNRFRLLGLAAVLITFAQACGSGDDDGLTEDNAPPSDGGAGSGGMGGTGGSAGTGGTSGSGGTGGTGGMGGEAGTGGSSGTGGSAGTAGTGGAAGQGGTGGSAGSAGTGGSAGAGGSAGCPGGCDDGVDCTVDSCVQGDCKHAPGPCPPMQVCDPAQGCVAAPICADNDTCEQLWGSDPCKADIRCDDATATCTYDLLDKDGDDHAPLVCGGDDCDDSDADRHPAMSETCDGKDNDCDGDVDEGATCPGLLECTAGACTCPPANACGTDCVDKQTDPDHCGACFNACPSAAVCVAGACDCPDPNEVCGSACVNTQTDADHCGGCNQQCATGYSCVGGSCTCLGTSCGGQCVDTQNDPDHCGGCGQACPPTATCVTGACTCPPTAPDECGGTCVDLDTNEDHCGSCFNACPYGECESGQCPACTPGGMLILLDTSGSMGNYCGGQTCMQEQFSAVQTFVGESASEGLSVGVTYYPRGASALCTVPDYATPSVAMDLLPANATPIINSMIGKTATGASVVVASLGGGIEAAKAWSSAEGRPAVVVMINDGGLGIGCYNETVAQAVSTAAAGYNGTPSVRTFVIGLNSTGYPEDAQWWAEVPPAGGGTLQDTGLAGQAAILDALRTIRDEIACP